MRDSDAGTADDQSDHCRRIDSGIVVAGLVRLGPLLHPVVLHTSQLPTIRTKAVRRFEDTRLTSTTNI